MSEGQSVWLRLQIEVEVAVVDRELLTTAALEELKTAKFLDPDDKAEVIRDVLDDPAEALSELVNIENILDGIPGIRTASSGMVVGHI